MDLKDLNNYQLVLLVLLVSFVTSIATGITTVYLLQSSPTVSSVINQVIQRTVEKVVPEEEGGTRPPQIVTNNQVLVVKESDIVPVVVENIKKATITISHDCSEQESGVLDAPCAANNSYGFIVDADGQFLTTSRTIGRAGVYPFNDKVLWFDFTAVTQSENLLTDNKFNFPEGKKISMPYVLQFAKVLPSEGETLVLYDAKTATVKKIYADKVDVLNKRFTVNYPLAGYEGLPIVNLDGKIAGIVYSVSGTPTVLSALEFSNQKFKVVSLTSN